MGYFGAANVGGQYSKKRDEKDVPEGSIRINGVDIRKNELHHPLLGAVNLGATLYRVMHSKAHRTDSEMQGPTEGAIQTIAGLVQDVPFVKETADISGLLDPNKRGNTLGRMIGSRLVPGIVSQPTAYFDKNEAGQPVKRTPHGIIETAEAGIPGLRGNVPQAAEGDISKMNAQQAAQAYSGATNDVKAKSEHDVVKKIISSHSDDLLNAKDAIKESFKHGGPTAEQRQALTDAREASDKDQVDLMNRHGVPLPADLPLHQEKAKLDDQKSQDEMRAKRFQEIINDKRGLDQNSPEWKNLDDEYKANAAVPIVFRADQRLKDLDAYFKQRADLEQRMKDGYLTTEKFKSEIERLSRPLIRH